MQEENLHVGRKWETMNFLGVALVECEVVTLAGISTAKIIKNITELHTLENCIIVLPDGYGGSASWAAHHTTVCLESVYFQLIYTII